MSSAEDHRCDWCICAVDPLVSGGAVIALSAHVPYWFPRSITTARAITIGGWTPGVRALVAGRILSCGCRIGVYQTCSREFIAIVDAAADQCQEHHHLNSVAWRAVTFPR
jgi:hypothetical protein